MYNITNNIPLYIHVHIDTHKHTHHILLIHSSVDCFYLLAIVNSATLNMGVQISVWVPTFSSFECIPRSGISGSCGKSILNFLMNCQTVFQSDYRFTLPPTVHRGSKFSMFSLTLGVFCFYDNSHPDGCEVEKVGILKKNGGEKDR